MARVKGALMTRKRRKKVLKLAKGYWGSKSRHFKMAKQAVMKSGNYAYIGRKQRKRDFRRLWITRISAACKMNGIKLFHLYERSEEGWHHPEPQDAVRDRHCRRGRIQGSGRAGQGRSLISCQCARGLRSGRIFIQGNPRHAGKEHYDRNHHQPEKPAD